MNFERPQISLTKNLKTPTFYARAIDEDFQHLAFNEERILSFASRWRNEVFAVSEGSAIDLEIGTGNGLHFFHRSFNFPEKCIVGLELKYKPLIQSIRRVAQKELKNARMGRAHAFNLDLIFSAGEINDVYVHFPDPWTSPRKPQNRILGTRMLQVLWNLQRPGSIVEFKTDSVEAFEWSLENIKQSDFKIEFLSRNLHGEISSFELHGQTHFETQFEKIFRGQMKPIHCVLLRRN